MKTKFGPSGVKGGSGLIPFMNGVIADLRAWGKRRTAETYVATLNSFNTVKKMKKKRKPRL